MFSIGETRMIRLPCAEENMRIS